MHQGSINDFSSFSMLLIILKLTDTNTTILAVYKDCLYVKAGDSVWLWFLRNSKYMSKAFTSAGLTPPIRAA